MFWVFWTFLSPWQSSGDLCDCCHWMIACNHKVQSLKIICKSPILCWLLIVNNKNYYDTTLGAVVKNSNNFSLTNDTKLLFAKNTIPTSPRLEWLSYDSKITTTSWLGWGERGKFHNVGFLTLKRSGFISNVASSLYFLPKRHFFFFFPVCRFKREHAWCWCSDGVTELMAHSQQAESDPPGAEQNQKPLSQESEGTERVATRGNRRGWHCYANKDSNAYSQQTNKQTKTPIILEKEKQNKTTHTKKHWFLKRVFFFSAGKVNPNLLPGVGWKQYWMICAYFIEIISVTKVGKWLCPGRHCWKIETY